MRFSFLIVLLITTTVKSQVSNIDSIYGKVKRVREKVFDISNKDNPYQIEIDEYSDSMILIPDSADFQSVPTKSDSADLQSVPTK